MGPPRYGHPEIDRGIANWVLAPSEYLTGRLLLREQPTFGKQRTVRVRSKFYGQAERAISNGKLNALLRLHIRPIKQVVFLCPSKLTLGRSHLGEGFTLICIQRLS